MSDSGGEDHVQLGSTERSTATPLAPSVVPTMPSEVAKPAGTKPVDPESPPWGLTTKAIIASALLILLAISVWRFQFLISPLMVAAIIAYLLNPLISWLQHKWGITRAQAVLIVYAILVIITAIGGFFLGVAVAQQTVKLWRNLPVLLPQVVENVQQRAQFFAGVRWSVAGYTFEPGVILAAIDLESFARNIADSSRTLVGSSGRWLAGVAGATFGTLSNTLFVVVVSIYLAMDGPRIGNGISEMAHQPGYRRDAKRLIHDSIKIWNAYLRGQLILCFVVFVLVSLFLTILGVNNSLELGILSGLLEFLPIIGPVVSAGVAVIVALLQDGNHWGLAPWAFALSVLATMFLIQQVENHVLVPRIVGDALDLHPLVVLIGVLMGTSLAGLLGAVLAAPVIATLLLFGNYVWHKMLDLPPFPDEPPDRAKVDNLGASRSMAWLTGLFSSRSPRT